MCSGPGPQLLHVRRIFTIITTCAQDLHSTHTTCAQDIRPIPGADGLLLGPRTSAPPSPELTSSSHAGRYFQCMPDPTPPPPLAALSSLPLSLFQNKSPFLSPLPPPPLAALSTLNPQLLLTLYPPVRAAGNASKLRPPRALQPRLRVAASIVRALSHIM
jgi:hypothetical protein